MLNVTLIREEPDKVRTGLTRRGLDPKLVDKFLRADEDWRGKTAASDQLQAEQNAVTKELAAAQTDEGLAKAHILKRRIAEISVELEALAAKREELLDQFPNVPFDDVPDGANASANKVLREVGKKPEFDFEPKNYPTLATTLGLIDTKKASEVAGSRFGYLMREAVLLEFALVKLAFDLLVEEGFVPVVPPVMIRPKVFKGIGRLAADQKEERYYLERDDIYLVGSAEHTLAPLHMNQTLYANELPRRYVGFSTCFRREAGSYGKDTKGILRVHQFDKVEMFSFAEPSKSEEEHRYLLSLQEKLMGALKLPYRVVEISTGDMGWTDARQYDIEAWLPGSKEYRETHSCSNTTDFQARGIGVKYRAADGTKDFAHLLNATAIAVGRTLIAIIENYQTKAGTVEVPKALQKYAGVKEIKR